LKEAVLDKDSPIDLILLSFGDLEHVGALPLVVGRLGLTVPIYCTLPTMSLGYQALYEAHGCQPADSAGSTGGFSAFSLDDVDEAFGSMKGRRNGIRTLKFNEALVVKGLDLTITPINAGRCLGGAMWRIKWHNDEVRRSDFGHCRGFLGDKECNTTVRF
jgi:cleavage and polyadenylation specificity factor subunit 2